MKREFLQNLTVGEQPLPKEVIDAIMEEHGKSVQKSKSWQEKYEQAVAEHQRQLQQVTFEHRLETAITKHRGRNVKAICALLDTHTLASQEPEAVEQALEDLKQQCAYLFDQSETPPPYAPNTGAQVLGQGNAPATLAGALRERFENQK